MLYPGSMLIGILACGALNARQSRHKFDGWTISFSRTHERQFIPQLSGNGDFRWPGNYQWSSSAHASADSRLINGSRHGVSGYGNNQGQGTYLIIGNSLISRGRFGYLCYDIDFAGNGFVANGKTYIRE